MLTIHRCVSPLFKTKLRYDRRTPLGLFEVHEEGLRLCPRCTQAPQSSPRSFRVTVFEFRLTHSWPRWASHGRFKTWQTSAILPHSHPFLTKLCVSELSPSPAHGAMVGDVCPPALGSSLGTVRFSLFFEPSAESCCLPCSRLTLQCDRFCLSCDPLPRFPGLPSKPPGPSPQKS